MSNVEAVLLILGALLILTAGIGIVRLPSLLCRAHALSKAATLGLTLLLLALLVHMGTVRAAIKIIAVICFHFITLPIAAQIFGAYSYREGKEEHL